LLGFVNIYFSCLMIMCQSLIGWQKPLGFYHWPIEVIHLNQ
jgi:hypothetical protein